MAVFFGKRVANVITPDGDESHAEFEAIPRGPQLRVEVTQPRSLPYHKLYFALCNRIGRGVGQTTDWIDRAFRVETGHFDIYEYGGAERFVIRSIAFHKMDGVAFHDFFERCVSVAYSKWRIDPASVADLLVPQEDQKRR